MPTTLLMHVPENSPAATKVLEALAALGAEVSRDGRTISTTVPTDACAVCGEAFALSSLEHKGALGGLACEVCRGIAARIYAQFQADVRRHWAEVRSQLPRAVLDVRAGAESPVFYHGLD